MDRPQAYAHACQPQSMHAGPNMFGGRTSVRGKGTLRLTLSPAGRHSRLPAVRLDSCGNRKDYRPATTAERESPRSRTPPRPPRPTTCVAHRHSALHALAGARPAVEIGPSSPQLRAPDDTFGRPARRSSGHRILRACSYRNGRRSSESDRHGNRIARSRWSRPAGARAIPTPNTRPFRRRRRGTARAPDLSPLRARCPTNQNRARRSTFRR